MDFVNILSQEFNLQPSHSANIIELIAQGNTIPFIARYRKEMTGSCDDQILREFADRLDYLTRLHERKNEVQSSITEQGKWTDELAAALEAAQTMTEVEDIYRPYKQKKKTRASVAVERGLQPLADYILAQSGNGKLDAVAAQYIDEEKGVPDCQAAIDGAKDIIAEIVSDDAAVRKQMREYLYNFCDISTKLLENDNAKTYDMYADYKEKISSIVSHRILAINRGEKEQCLKVGFVYDIDEALKIINSIYLKNHAELTPIVEDAAKDSFERLIYPSVEREVRNQLTEKASEQAIKMFEVNLRPLLLQPPLKNKTIMAVDPAYRTGCKIAVIDSNSNVLDTAVVYPTPPQNKTEEAAATLRALISKHNIDVISIGNGTASKEAEIFVADMIKQCDRPVQYAVVNEAGASVYSASKLAAEEFPQYDVSLRSAVSIARRLQDPLAELIKIDVKSIGVGQYQHDMPQNRLSQVLEGVVEDCVNSVGVDLNTASASLLMHVAGLNSATAKNIVEYRKKQAFKSRAELLNVNKLGAKAYQQCAGFLRIPDGENFLDNTSVHPESYGAADKLLKMFGADTNAVKELPFHVERQGKEKVAQMCGVGVPTLDDIIAEILRPGRDIRDSLPKPILRSDLLDIKDLREGMILNGTVRNVIDFGAFVDIGVHQDGLVHISQICDRYIRHPSEVLTVGEAVTVKVLAVDLTKNKISLTMKIQENATIEKFAQPPKVERPKTQKQPQPKTKPKLPKNSDEKPQTLEEMLLSLQNKYKK